MSRRFGNAPCILAGFDNCSGDCVIYMEADLQDPPELIPKLIEKFENGFDVVHTVRTKRLGESKLQIFLTKIAYRIINKLSYIPLPLDAGDFKLISRRAIEHIRNPHEYNPYVRGLSVWVGFKQAFVEYVLESRPAGKSKYPIFPISLLLKDRYESDKKIKNIKSPILIMHGEADKIVPFWMGEKIFQLANEPKYSYFSKYDDHMMDFNNDLINSIKLFIKSLN